ncbi:unnamed protein product, partial [Ectocarpus fasciculatus]
HTHRHPLSVTLSRQLRRWRASLALTTLSLCGTKHAHHQPPPPKSGSSIQLPPSADFDGDRSCTKSHCRHWEALEGKNAREEITASFPGRSEQPKKHQDVEDYPPCCPFYSAP